MAKQASEHSPVELLDAIRKKEFAPVYFFYGEEEFLMQEAVDALLASAVEPQTRAFNCDILNGEDVEGKDIAAIALSFPMMSDRRIVVVKDFDRAGEIDPIERYIEQPVSTTILVLTVASPDMRKKPYPSLKKNTACYEFRRFYDNEIPPWIQERARKLHRSIAPDAAEMLNAYVGNSLRELANQIEKLLIAIGSRTKIEIKDVEAVVGISKEYSVFELAKAVGEKNAPRAYAITERMIECGEPPVFIVVMLVRHFGILWKLSELARTIRSESELARAVRVSPYFLKEYLAQLRRYPLRAIEDAFLALVKADEKLKSSSGDHKIILDVMLAEIMHAPVNEEAGTLNV
jgi:DNA polymerase III subunit delta